MTTAAMANTSSLGLSDHQGLLAQRQLQLNLLNQKLQQQQQLREQQHQFQLKQQQQQQLLSPQQANSFYNHRSQPDIFESLSSLQTLPSTMGGQSDVDTCNNSNNKGILLRSLADVSNPALLSSFSSLDGALRLKLSERLNESGTKGNNNNNSNIMGLGAQQQPLPQQSFALDNNMNNSQQPSNPLRVSNHGNISNNPSCHDTVVARQQLMDQISNDAVFPLPGYNNIKAQAPKKAQLSSYRQAWQRLRSPSVALQKELFKRRVQRNRFPLVGGPSRSAILQRNSQLTQQQPFFRQNNGMDML